MFSDNQLNELEKAFREGLPDDTGKSQLGILLIYEIRKTKKMLEASTTEQNDEHAFDGCVCKNTEQVVEFALLSDGTVKVKTYKTNNENIFHRILNAVKHVFRKEDLDHYNTVFLKYDSIEKINNLTSSAINLIKDAENIH